MRLFFCPYPSTFLCTFTPHKKNMGCPKLDILEQDYTSFGLAEITAGNSLCSRESGCKTRRMYRYGFNTQEKENEISGSEGTHYSAEFWMYDTRIARRWNLDPVDQISISNYAVMGSNPILNVDHKGDKVDPASQQEVDDMKTETTTKIADLTTQRDATTKSATDISGNATYNPTEQAQVNEFNSRIGELNTVMNDITTIENDQINTFKLNAVAPQNFVNIIPTVQDVQTKTYTLNYERGNMGNRIHEVAKHGAQISKGDYIFSVASGNVNISMNVGLTHYDTELAAYKGEYSFSGSLKGFRIPMSGSQEAQLNTMAGSTGSSLQLNQRFQIQNYLSIDLSLIRNMTEGAMGAKTAY